MRIWFRMIRDTHLINDFVYENTEKDTRTHKVFKAVDEMCLKFDLQHPVWMDSTVRDFKRSAKARFYPDAFVEEVDFDYIEIYVIEE
ncbi:MAG: hypothetical protein K6E56_01480, partial [Lachnospiraceae bacterium]|nr:hypothetical protein [Lachnospiraceae bacterium]